MHMYNNFLVLFLRKDLESWNHGFQPGLGTMTAWRAFLKKARKAKYVYEFDFKQFFPSVTHTTVWRYLKRKGVPSDMVRWLEEVNKQQPKLPAEQKLSEEKVIEDTEHLGWLATLERKSKELLNYTGYREDLVSEDNPYGEDVEYFEELYRDKMTDDYLRSLLPPLTSVIRAPVNEEEEDPYGELDRWKGLPQGLNTSPILSLCALIDWQQALAQENISLLMYADDGIMYSDQYFMPPTEVSGIAIHPEKSGWVVFNGEPKKKKFKFLGMEYDFEKRLISGKTRKGSTLSFDSTRIELLHLLKRIMPEKGKLSAGPNRDHMDRLADSGVLGLVQAKMYIGDWEDLDFLPKKWARHPLSWYQSSLDAKGNPTMSSQACQYLSLVVNATMKGKYHLSYPRH